MCNDFIIGYNSSAAKEPLWGRSEMFVVGINKKFRAP